jgi:ParB-like chromosome segregation protein Spo0J
MTEIIYVPINRLSDNGNVRSDTRHTSELQDAIVAVGLVNPLTVFEGSKEGWYQVVSGGRRLSALRALHRARRIVPGLKFTEIPCRLIDKPESEEDGLVYMVAANSQRELPHSDVGRALKLLMLGKRWTLVKTASAWGITPTKARLYLELAHADHEIQRRVDAGEISLSAFGKLASAPPEVMEEAANTDGRITVEKARKMAADAEVKSTALGIVVNDEPDIVAILSGIKIALTKIMKLPALSMREKNVLVEIREIVNE